MSACALVMLLAGALTLGYLSGWVRGLDQGYKLGLWDACNESTKEGEQRCSF